MADKQSGKLSRRACLKVIAAGSLAGCSEAITPGSELVFPGDDWLETRPEEAGFSTSGLDAAIAFLRDHAFPRFGWHVSIVAGGRLIVDRGEGMKPLKRRPMASICKSVYASMLGIAIHDGRIDSVDDPLIKYFPEIAELDPLPRFENGEQARFSNKDREVTLRQLVTMTGGFLRPQVAPGSRWIYGTPGMIALLSAVARQYGYRDDVASENGAGALLEKMIRDPIGAGWSWKYQRLAWSEKTQPLEPFNKFAMLHMTPRRDMARLGLLWLANGRWRDQQVIPETWHRQCTRVAQTVRACEPEANQVYGQGFWVNEAGRLWPNLPQDSYMAAGAANHQLWICPSLSLVVALSPGLAQRASFRQTVADASFLEKVVDARLA